MTSTPERIQRVPQVYRPLRRRALFLLVVGTLGFMAIPVAAQAASRSGAPQVRHTSTSTAKAQSSICGTVSAAAVSSIIGYKVPAGTFSTFNVKASKTNYETAAVLTTCTYGLETSMAAIQKAVTLSAEVLAKPLTASEIQQSIKKASALVKVKFSAYSGLGVPAFYFSLTESGLTGQGITAIPNGTHYYSAEVETKSVSKATLAALTKLAEKL